jgi:hypothetical protein
MGQRGTGQHDGDAAPGPRPTPERPPDDRDLLSGSAASGSIPSTRDFLEASHSIEPPSVPDGTFVRVFPEEHPLPRATECTVYFQDYHRSSSKLGRFAKIVGVDPVGHEYLLMLDNFESLSAPMRRVEWRKIST